MHTGNLHKVFFVDGRLQLSFSFLFRFVFHDNEMGLEIMYNSGRCRSTVTIGAEVESENLSTFNLLTEIEKMQNQETGIMTAMDLIEIGYNDMKEKLEATKNPLVSKEAGLALLPQSDFGTDVHKVRSPASL
jgi:hypothetical protein